MIWEQECWTTGPGFSKGGWRYPQDQTNPMDYVASLVKVSGDFANEWFRQRHVRQRLRSLRQTEKSLRQRPTGHFANVLVYSK